MRSKRFNEQQAKKALQRKARHIGRYWFPIKKDIVFRARANAWHAGTHWWMGEKPKMTQAFVPNPHNLRESIGMDKNDSIVMFAGCYGDWANALAKEGKVDYSDVSPSMANFVRFEKRGNIQRIKVAPAEAVPQSVHFYDWSFSFEPFPLHDGSLKFALARSLLNRKGGKLIYQKISPDTANKVSRQMSKIARLYGATFVRGIRPVLAAEGFENVYREQMKKIPETVQESWDMEIFTLQTNAAARAKVGQDLKVLRWLNHWQETKNVIARAKWIAKKVGIPLEKVLESRKRLNVLNRLEFNPAERVLRKTGR
ncbi:MAG: hypothetical protein V1847_01410 [Candidatus Diapherotrites archaeon]